jgi:hypothetical protein
LRTKSPAGPFEKILFMASPVAVWGS